MHRNILSVVCSALPLFFAAGHAHGDAGDVFNVTFAQAFGYDSNLFKLSPNIDSATAIGSSLRSDSYSSSTVRLAADKNLGRQVLRAAAGLTSRRYDRFARLDSNLRDYSLGYDWQLGHLWSGTLAVSRMQTIPGFNDFRPAVRNIVTTDMARLQGAMRLHADWQLNLGASMRRIQHSAEANAYANSSVVGIEAGLRYLPGNGKEFGALVRQSDAVLANRQLANGTQVDNSYREDAYEFNTVWQTGGSSSLRAGLGWVERRHRELAGRDYAGQTGNLGWKWAPTGKTSLGLSLRQELGSQDSLLATYSTVRSLGLSAGWQPTAKLGVSTSIERRRREMGGDPATLLSGQPARSDDERFVNIGLSYAAWRDLQLQASWRSERRDSSVAAYSYTSRQYVLSASLTF
jgi:exopolysaccharide biosynthesis operon protein EpsL